MTSITSHPNLWQHVKRNRIYLEHIAGDMNVSEFRQDANDTGFYPEENVEPDDIGDIVD